MAKPLCSVKRNETAKAMFGKNIADVVPDHATDCNDLEEKGGQTNILVLDFTDESFDVSILTVDIAVFGVLLRSGDILLEGDLFYLHKCIIEYFIRLIKNRNDISKDNRALRREIEALFNKNESGISKDLKDLFRKTMRPVKKAMDDAGLGNHQIDNIVIIGGTIRFPTIKQLLLDFFDAKVPNKGMNPYEAVAYGAAGGILTKDILLYAVGIETSDGVMTKVIPKNTMIPTKKSQLFTTNQDLQTTVCIQVYQGDRSLTKDCSNLGTFNLTGIPPAPRGAPRIKVTFEVDVNGTLNVKAEDMGTGKYQKITITNDKGRLSQEEIDLMVKEAEEFAEEDMEVNESNDAHDH